MTEFETDYLAHHGIKGQKWGVRRTPEELGHRPKGSQKTKTNLVKKAVDSYKQNREKDKADSHERVKKYIRKHPEKIVRYGQTLTKEEANELVNQIQFDRKLKSIRDEEIAAGWKKVDNIQRNIGTLYNLFDNSKKLYNAAADINNALIDAGVIDSKKSWVKIGDNSTKKEDRSYFEKIIRTGTREEVLSNIGNLTSKELEDAMKRINYENQLKGIKKK